MEKIKKNLPLIIVVLVIIIAGVYFYFNPIKTTPASTAQSNPQEIADKAITYINDNILGVKNGASLVSVIEVGEILEMKFTINQKEYTSYVTKDGKFLFPEGYDLSEKKPENTLGNFSVSTDQVCQENNKPIVYFFGSTGCPHCKWEHPIVEKVVQAFGNQISFHNNMDATSTDMDVFSKYSTGGIPTIILGCKYYRVGSGENAGEETETKDLTALICKLTNNQPSSVCSQVQDLISQIQD